MSSDSLFVSSDLSKGLVNMYCSVKETSSVFLHLEKQSRSAHIILFCSSMV
jgi:hypothetical protein